ncbi:MAG: M48 family metalloprotease [Candidatus Berkiella sp.]
MNFFEQQEKARRKSKFLIFYLVIAIVLIILAVNCTIVGAIVILFLSQANNTTGEVLTRQEISLSDLQILFYTVSLYVSPVVILTILIGTIFKMYTLNKGGVTVANMVNATPIDDLPDNLAKKQFKNVVEEMAIASGMPVPGLFVMTQEDSINAFVAGKNPDDTVMVITQGALDSFSRDELQGVVGHEFSHILNGDMHINMRMMGILGGLFIIGQAGYYFIRIMGRSSNSTNRSNNSQSTIAFWFVGLGLFFIGYFGLFLGRVIKAAMSRQRERLADAASVQYTRNPLGLILALKRIQQSKVGGDLNSKNADDLSHMCFWPTMKVMKKNRFATHPPIEERIKALDPQNQYTQITPIIHTPKEKTKELTMSETIRREAITAIMAQQDEQKANEVQNSKDAEKGFVIFIGLLVVVFFVFFVGEIFNLNELLKSTFIYALYLTIIVPVIYYFIRKLYRARKAELDLQKDSTQSDKETSYSSAKIVSIIGFTSFLLLGVILASFVGKQNIENTIKISHYQKVDAKVDSHFREIIQSPLKGVSKITISFQYNKNLYKPTLIREYRVADDNTIHWADYIKGDHVQIYINPNNVYDYIYLGETEYIQGILFNLSPILFIMIGVVGLLVISLKKAPNKKG